LCFSLGFFSHLSVNICQYRFADHSILPQCYIHHRLTNLCYRSVYFTDDFFRADTINISNVSDGSCVQCVESKSVR